MNADIKANILDIFAEFDGAPDKHGDSWQYPIILKLYEMKLVHGDAMRESLQEAISETKQRLASTSGIQFLSELPDSAPFLADLATNHDDDQYRSAAVDALMNMGARGILHDIYGEVPAANRDHIGRALATIDAAAMGSYVQLTDLLVRGRRPGRYLLESVVCVGKNATLEAIALVRDHEHLPVNVRQAAQGVYLWLQSNCPRY